MRSRLLAVAAAVAVASLLSVSGAGADTTLQPATQRVNFNIGCEVGADGTTCAGTEYWLGKDTGNNSVGTLGDITPVNAAVFATDGEYALRNFVTGETLAPTYVLRAGQLTGQVTTSAYLGGGELSADSGIRVIIRASRAGTFQSVTIADLEVTKTVVTPSLADGSQAVYAFTADIPAELDGVRISGLTADVGQRHVTVLGNGFMDGEGGSYFNLPYYKEVTTP